FFSSRRRHTRSKRDWSSDVCSSDLYWAGFGHKVFQPRTYLNPGYQGTLGSGFPTALGAQVAKPGQRVISINGDGGFMFNAQELRSEERRVGKECRGRGARVRKQKAR